MSALKMGGVVVKIAFILLNVFVTAAVIAHGTAAQGETFPSHSIAAIGYEIIGEPERLSVAESAESIALQPTLYDVFKNSDYYFGSNYRSKLPNGIDPWADYHHGDHGHSYSHGLFRNYSGCGHSGCGHSGCNPLAAILDLPFSLFGGRHATGCDGNCDGGSDCDANLCYSGAPSTRQPPQKPQKNVTPADQQPTPVYRHPQTIEPPRPMNPVVEQDVEQQPVDREDGQGNGIDVPENDLPVNVIPDDYVPAEPRVLTPTRVEAPSDSDFRVRRAAPLNDAPTALPPANGLPELDLLDDSAQYLDSSPSNTLGVKIRIAAPQQALSPYGGVARSGHVRSGTVQSDPVRSGKVREMRTAALVKPTHRSTGPGGATVRFRGYQ